MRLYLDENFPPSIVAPIRSIYTDHEFRSWREEGLGTTLDLDLFPELAARGFQAIITRDRHQLKNPVERAAVATAGLAWVGLADKKLSGVEMLANTAASLIAGLRFVLMEAPTEPTWYELRHIPHQREQRLKHGRL